MRYLPLLLALAACVPTVADEPAVPEMAPIRMVDAVIHGDTRFDPLERIIVADSLEAWRRFTDGRARISIVWDFDGSSLDRLALAGEPILSRMPAWVPPGNEAGAVDAGIIYVVADKCPSLRACVLHELGHYLGMQHVTFHGAVMAAHNPGDAFTTADRYECALRGLCAPLRLDRTTVTTTVDPHIAPVFPEYP